MNIYKLDILWTKSVLYCNNNNLQKHHMYDYFILFPHDQFSQNLAVIFRSSGNHFIVMILRFVYYKMISRICEDDSYSPLKLVM